MIGFEANYGMKIAQINPYGLIDYEWKIRS